MDYNKRNYKDLLEFTEHIISMYKILERNNQVNDFIAGKKIFTKCLGDIEAELNNKLGDMEYQITEKIKTDLELLPQYELDRVKEKLDKLLTI